MAKFYGIVGYAKTTETAPGVWAEVITERNYSGDVIRNTRRLQSSENLNDDLVINNIISIIADPYAYQNFHTMRYVYWMGVFWKITSVEVQRPRLLLTIGGVYNVKKT
jgi:hypothetical protein